ncbi:SH2 domain-containing adapter protein B-like isoform X2 [Latimeria chalumnae]|uniref:SH2 domain-containing adapter protein B-like isoform X2 n=1 Tax=Latimeria chalumnae TaxID=7897 RepID=UPI00313E4D70
MAKWLKYFSMGNNKTKSPPQPPKPDYREKKNGRTENHISPFPNLNEESDLLKAYRAQKARDFEDPYNNGPGSSLRKLRAMCQEEEEKRRDQEREKVLSSTVTPSPPLFRSNSERRPAGYTTPEIKYISPKHRLIKIESNENRNNVVTWSPSNTKKHNKSEENNSKKEKVNMADDYSDPFDAKSELKSKRGKGENGYMEPFEAQKMMAEIQRQESQTSQKKTIQLYDTPYEPEGNGLDSDSESVISQHLRESRLPQDDDRPADEYDQPWEWNKVPIPVLAAQFNSNERKQSSPSPSSDRRRQLRPPGGSFKPIKHGSPEFCGILGERVDPTIPLEKQVWYHGAISRTDAENLLRLCKECSYLVRNSQTSKHDYSLSLKSSQGFMHMKLTKTKDKYILGQNSLPFDSVPEVIHYYTTRKLPIKGAEHLSLLYPVAVRTL